MKTRWQKLRSLRYADGEVLLRCLWVIPVVEFSVRWRAPRRWLPAATASGPPARENPPAAAAGQRIARWVDAAYRRSPFRPTCLTRSLVLYRILRARGIPCQLHIGLRKRETELEGHAWIGSGGLASDPEGFEAMLSF